MPSRVSVLCAALLLATVPRMAGAAAEPDFAAAHTEVVATLKNFVRLDTTNPPGNETRGAEFLKAILEREGIPAEIVGRDPARGNVIARLKGSGKKKPLLLMGHIDTVGIERDKWTVDPLAAIEKDGFIYGRGASDDKCMTTVCLEIMLLLKRLNIPLDRDVIFSGMADEESSGWFGVRYLVDKHWDKITCEFALNEGGTIVEEKGDVKYVSVSTTEKVPRTLFLAAKGVSAHASRPRLDNPVTHLAVAVGRVGEWFTPMRLNDTTRAFFTQLAKISPPDEAWFYTHLEDPVVGPQAQEVIRRTNFINNSMLRTTISPTVLKAGFRVNVVPGDALATLDVRALPDEDWPAFLTQLRTLINDPSVDVVEAEGDGRKFAAPSRIDNEMFRALEHAQASVFPGRATIPSMSTGATDSAYLRPLGVQAYGLGSVVDQADGGARVHGNDERTKIAGLRPFLELVYRAVVEVAAAPAAN
jgi:acetylornithine deacetylase/succinyl-diaminopimelate desuccinylase-like protein